MIANKKQIIAIAIVGLLSAHPAFADKPDFAGGGNGRNGQDNGQSSEKRPSSENGRQNNPHAKSNQHEKKDDSARGESRRFTTERRDNSSKDNSPKRDTPDRSDRSGKSSYRDNHSDRQRDEVTVQIRFNDQQRTYIHDYYREEFRRGHCPPGLAKKHNGCMPPGQAKRWRVGYPLERSVTYYDVAPSILVQIGSPPVGYRYVRVAADILMIAVGTGLVVDAIADLNDM